MRWRSTEPRIGVPDRTAGACGYQPARTIVTFGAALRPSVNARTCAAHASSAARFSTAQSCADRPLRCAAGPDMVQNRFGDFEPDAEALQAGGNRSPPIVNAPRQSAWRSYGGRRSLGTCLVERTRRTGCPGTLEARVRRLPDGPRMPWPRPRPPAASHGADRVAGRLGAAHAERRSPLGRHGPGRYPGGDDDRCA